MDDGTKPDDRVRLISGRVVVGFLVLFAVAILLVVLLRTLFF